jgi:WD40 repeat protein
MGSLFVSHSSQDSAEVARLCEWLTEQGFRSFFLDFDPERGFAAGAKWEAELYAQLRRADAVLFVGSAASVASQWCFAELTMSRSLGKAIIPVAIRAGGSHPLLVDTQTVDLPGTDGRGYERLRRRLSAAELDPERTFDWDPSRSPFPGLESFQERDAAVFFGRQAETEQLLAQMRSSRRRYMGRLIAVVGPSGSGKSSLVRAGLLPRLGRVQPPWVVLSVLRPADRPLHQLALVLADAFRDAGAPRTLQSVELALREGGAGLVMLADQLGHLYAGELEPAVLVFVDQAEELIAPVAGEEHAAFLALLHGATRGAGSVWSLLTLRSEFLSAFLEAEGGEFVFDDQLLVGPLDGARLAEVIERPADRAGVSFAPGLVGRMVADTGGGDALPLLAHTLAALHQRVRGRRGATISIADYEELGGVVGALRRSADEEHRRLSEHGLSDLVLPTLSRLVTVGPEGQPTRRRLARAVFRGHETEIVEAFVDARLLTSTEVEGESIVEVAHEALLRQWPPLADAIERDREELQLRSELERQAEDWQRSGRRDEYLLFGERLAVAGRLSNSPEQSRTDLTDLDLAFLDASQDQQRVQEMAKRRRTRITVVGLASALVVVSTLALVALVQSSQARNERDTAQAERLATNAASELASDPGQSLMFAMKAYARKPTLFAEGTLRVAASQAVPQLVLRSRQGTVDGVAFAGDGRHLASAGDGNTVRIWDWRAPHRPPTILRGHQGIVLQVAFASDGRHLASSGDDGTVRVWDWRAPHRPPTILRGHQDFRVMSVAFAGDGRHLASAGDDGTVRIWDWRAPHTPPTILRGHRSSIFGVAFADDGRHLASASPDGTVRVWDWRAPHTPPTILRGHHDIVIDVAFAGDGRHLASASGDGTVLVWDWRAPHTPPTILRGHHGFVSKVAFADDGRALASAGEGDGTVRIWDWRAPRTPPIILRGHLGSVSGVAFAGGGRQLASAGSDGTVRVWDWRAPHTPPTILRDHQGTVSEVAFASDGRHLASAGSDGTVRIWDWRAPRIPPTILRGHQGTVNGVAFAGDGRHLASVDDETVRIWDWRAPHTPPTVLRAKRSVFDVAFLGDGRHLATANIDGTMQIWDWRAPGTPPTTLRIDRDYVSEVAVASDQRHLASAGADGTVRVWDWRALHTEPIILRGHQGTVNGVAFAGDGRHLASAGDDGTVRIWDWRAPHTAPIILRGHQGIVLRVAFASDGRNLASSGEDGTVRVWDWRAPRIPPTILRGHHGNVEGLAFAGDGRYLASAGDDGTVWVRDCQRCGDIQSVLELARERVPQEIGSG